MQNSKMNQAHALMQNSKMNHAHTLVQNSKVDQAHTLMQNSKLNQAHTLIQSSKMDQIQIRSPKKRGRVSESLDEFLKCIIKNCSKTLDPSPRKRGRPAEPLEICDPFLCYNNTKPFSKRGRPPINLVWPGCIPNHSTEKGEIKGEIIEESEEILFSPEVVNEKEDVKVVMMKNKKKKESGRKFMN